MTEVWIVEGYFGDFEWIEAIYATEGAAIARVAELQKGRRSDVLPPDHWAQGLCKFSAEPHEVLS